MQVEKNANFDIHIEDMTKDGEGVGKFQGFPFFVKDAVIGDRVKIKVIKAKKNYAYGRLEKILKPSKDRVEPKCPVARSCGGCTLQHLSYEKQLEFKYNHVANCLKRIGGIENVDELMKPIVGMVKSDCDELAGAGEQVSSSMKDRILDNSLISPNLCEHGPWNYRNKAQFPVGKDKNGNLVTGFYAGRSHVIIDQPYCYLQAEGTEEICAIVKEFMTEYHIAPYDEVAHSGIVRHILTRVGVHTGQVMVCIIVNAKELPYAEELAQMLQEVKGIASISYNVNMEKTNRILGDKTVTVWGEDTIEDTIGEVRFEISPKSFFQVNPVQTEVLYGKALEYANLTGEETVWDLYCGIGTISLFLAQKAKQVYGVEIVPEAIEDAKRNAKLNGFENTTFYVGKAEEVLPKWYAENSETEGAHPDVIVVDPPRKGCDEMCLDTIVKMQPKRVVYVSCDPATLARDVKWLQERGYELQECTPVDMFPHSVHVETVVALHRTNS